MDATESFYRRPPALLGAAFLALLILAGCSSRQVQDSLTGSTAQRLVSYAVDELAQALPERDFEPLRGDRIVIDSSFVGDPRLRDYADRRLATELRSRFDIEVVSADPESANSSSAEPAAGHVLQIFYTSLGTDRDERGFYVPLGFVPGVDQTTQIDLLTLEQFHGVAELYYYLDDERIDDPLRARIRTDALGLPIITIPLSTLP
ncbi:hypothetical protein [Halomonas denitrificans]|nr:hypothetical protein [Halomonas denitrificans]